MGNNDNQVCGIFTLEGIEGENAVKIKHLENLKSRDEKIMDSLVKTYHVMKFINGEVYDCNITNHYLMQSKKQPVFLIHVKYNKYMVKPLLYTVGLFFTIDSEVKSSEELLKKPLQGKFSLEVIIGNQTKKLDQKIEKFSNNDEMIENLVQFTKTEEMKELISELVEVEEEKRRKLYGKEFEQFKEIPKPTLCLDDYMD